MGSNAERSLRVSVLETEGRHMAGSALVAFQDNPPQQNSDSRQGTGPLKGSLSARPFLFSSSMAWIVFDFTLALAIAFVMQMGLVESPVPIHSSYSWVLAGLPFALLVLVLAHLAGLYRMGDNTALSTDATRILRAVILAGLALYGVRKLWGIDAVPGYLVGREVVLSGAAMFLGRVLWRRRRANLYRHDIALRNFLIVGADQIGQDVRSYLTSLRHSGYRFQGFVSTSEPSDDPRTVNEDEIVGEINNVIEIARSRFIDEIIFSRRPATPGVLSRILHQAQALGISIRLIPSLTETLVDRTDIEYVAGLATVAVYLARERSLPLFAKRSIDVALASITSVAFLPLCVLIAALIKLQSRGPVFYLSERVGHKGRVFTCFKFRTMIDNADAMREELEHLNERDRVTFKISNDPRVTPLGAFLRKYSLDELPQLWNVIRGDMSLVGPRPPLASEVAQYDTDHLHRLDAVPGITGLWQVEARQDPRFEKFVALDSSYINQWSIGLDLSILLRTISVVIRGTGS
jgi:exopolysaccharide biosynthesis polyprenyl glycosylphosphotransferase